MISWFESSVFATTETYFLVTQLKYDGAQHVFLKWHSLQMSSKTAFLIKPIISWTALILILKHFIFPVL